MIKKLFTLFTALLLLITFLIATPKKVDAQSANPQCLGVALAEYMNTVIEVTSNCPGTNQPISNIELLSPAFNMTNAFAFPIIGAATGAGANWGALYGISGNAYQLSYGSVLHHVTTFMNGSGLGSLNKPIYITETGYISGDQNSLRSDLSQIKTGIAEGYSFIGAAFFAPFDGLGSDEWRGFHLEDGQINYYCGGSCGIIGFNSADYYTNVDDSYYSRAAGLGMQTTVSIVNLDDGNRDAVIRARNNGFIPVIRVGHGGMLDNAGLTAEEYGAFLCGLDPLLSGRAYAIAGPNEPQSEYWFAPQCGLTPIDLGDDRRPIDEGFHLASHPCSTDANSEFHTLRRYPASPCDPLIPRSIPEAPQSEDPGSWNKYLTYACGTSLEFSTIGSFDPYGIHDPNETYTSAGGTEYLLTYCEPRNNLNGYEQVTCYRTVSFTVGMYFDQTKVGILGNTQLTKLTPRQKMNNYLSWYWTGIPQVGDNYLDYEIGEMYDFGGEEIAYENMVINYTGPVRKLMPQAAQADIKEVIRASRGEEVHNYFTNDTTQGPEDGVTGTRRLDDLFPDWKNIPLSSMEDVAGEVFFTSFGAGVGARSDPANPELSTAPFQFTITCAVGAHQNCP